MTEKIVRGEGLKARTCFPSEGGRAITFVFEVNLKGVKARTRDMVDIRLPVLFEKIRAEKPQAYEKLVLPLQSYFDDILNVSGYQANKPLIMRATSLKDEAVTLSFPQTIHYEAEGRVMRLEMGKAPRVRTAGLKDGFAIFRSGHVFYLLTLTTGGAEGEATAEHPCLDEFELIALQKLFSASEGTHELRNNILIGGEDALSPMDGFINQRLSGLINGEDGAPNAVRDVILPYVHEKADGVLETSWQRLSSFYIGIESHILFKEAIAPEAADEARARALAGFMQGVLDFAEQDAAEVVDSLQPIWQGADAVVFNRPGVLIEVAQNWRSFEVGAPHLGTCPYLSMTAICLAYNEVIVKELETALDHLIYGDTVDEVRAIPLKSLSEVINTIERKSGRQIALLKRNLQDRMAIFRTGMLARVPNLFRYSTEREMFENAEKARSLDLRFANVVSQLDRYEQVLEDTHHLGQYVGGRMINRFLVLIAALSLISIFGDLPNVVRGFAFVKSFFLGLFS